MNEIDYDAEEAKLDEELQRMMHPEEGTAESEEIQQEERQEAEEPIVEEKETAQEEMIPISRYKNAQARMTQATTEAAELRRRVGQLEQHISQLQAQIQSAHKETEITDDELKSVVDDYPGIAGPIVKKNKALEAKIAQLEQALQGVQQQSNSYAKTQAELENEKFWNTVRNVHPDADELTTTHAEELKEWVEQQAPIIQHGFYSGTAQDAIQVLSLYKQSKGQSVEKPDKLAAAKTAATPKVQGQGSKPSSQKTTFTREQIAKMTMDEFMKHESAIDEALAAGEIY